MGLISEEGRLEIMNLVVLLSVFALDCESQFHFISLGLYRLYCGELRKSCWTCFHYTARVCVNYFSKL
uniref:Uncharacterized protein n=1 Tax=Trichobilharzia regenti TaxID=157069 RepID=A0AA85J8S5_TRIRE|nr:unnamed protein product [Trichobilharzia regenti]